MYSISISARNCLINLFVSFLYHLNMANIKLVSCWQAARCSQTESEMAADTACRSANCYPTSPWKRDVMPKHLFPQLSANIDKTAIVCVCVCVCVVSSGGQWQRSVYWSVLSMAMNATVPRPLLPADKRALRCRTVDLSSYLLYAINPAAAMTTLTTFPSITNEKNDNRN